MVAKYGTAAFYASVDSSTQDGYDYSGYIYATMVLGLLSIIFSGLTLPIMMCIPELLVKMSLFFMLGLSGAMMIMSWVYGNIFGGILGTIFFAIFLCYAKAVWSRDLQPPFLERRWVCSPHRWIKSVGLLLFPSFLFGYL